MATVFMKWLETSPKDYDRGIQLLTLGRLQRLKEKIASEYRPRGDARAGDWLRHRRLDRA